jgi:adenylate cyclase
MSAEDYFPAAQRDLWKLIDQRRAAGAEVEPIDQRIWERFGDEGAILYTDLVGFTRQTAAIGITHFLQTILESHCLLRPIIEQHAGLVIEAIGDSMLIWFTQIESALRCALALQQACRECNQTKATCEPLLLCQGVGFGRVLRVGAARLAGGELNLACKLGEDLAVGLEILVSQSAQEAARSMDGVEFRLTEYSLPGSPQVYRAEPLETR